jgi:L-asparaginase / beta-aspartyl-peptidase
MSDFGIIVHGGAGSFTASSRAEIPARKNALKLSAIAGYTILRRRGSSTDAVEAAIKVMEDSKIFNAGSGSSLDLEGNITMDAAIMNGKLDCGAIAGGNVSKNPISLARLVMEKSDHVLIAGSEQLRRFSRSLGFSPMELRPTHQRLSQYSANIRLMKKGAVRAWPNNYRLLKSYFPENPSPSENDTVGAVAVDKESHVCAGVSTGGRWLKLPGRVGDSAIIGAGIYADDNSGAASATGMGEEIIRMCLCKTVCDLLKKGLGPQEACDGAISILTKARGAGNAGVIAIDKFGRFGSSRNTQMLQRAFMFNSLAKTHVAVLPTEGDPKQRSQNKFKDLMF